MRIILETMGGLGNRMTAVAEMATIAAEKNALLTVLWPLDKGLNCDFDTLFSINSDSTKVINIRQKHFSLNLLSRKIFARLFGRYFSYLKWNEYEKLNQALKEKDYVYVRTCHNFYDTENYFCLEAKSWAINKVNSVLPKDRQHLIGVHIRRTDHVRAITESPTSIFIDYMKSELLKDPETVFFVASDSKDEKDELKAIFGDIIICCEKIELKRDNEDGIKDALVELLCLSNCRKIIGSYRSTFSTTAASWHKNIELTVVQSQHND